MRDLKNSDKNSITVFDRLSNSKLTLFYKSPSVDDRVQYLSAITNTIGKKDPKAMIDLKLDWGKKFLTNVGVYSFCFGEEKLDTTKPGWKEMIVEGASDVLLVLVDTILESPSYLVKGDSIPFGMNSANS